MTTTYKTIVIGFGNHASLEIPPENLKDIGGNKRAPLKITINGYTYQSTATGVDGKCMVVFPLHDREACGASAGDEVEVTLELDDGYREVAIPKDLEAALKNNKYSENFHDLTYSKRKEFVRSVVEAKADETRLKRINKVIDYLNNS